MDNPEDSDSGLPPIPSANGDDADLCSPFLELYPITGASISVFDEAGNHSTICASDDTAGRLEEMQFDLGEGPHWEALHAGRPALVPDLQSGDTSAWPIFSEAVRQTEIGAVFAFPLTIGAVTIGVVDLYCSNSGSLSASALTTVLRLARSVTLPAARMAIRSANAEAASTTAGAAPELRRVVHQATGMILAQMNVNATEAFLLLRAHAFSSGRAVQDVAQDVVSRRLDFSVMAE